LAVLATLLGRKTAFSAMLLSSAQETAMTDFTPTARQPGLFAKLMQRLMDWLNEPVASDMSPHFSPRDWADLPVHHPIRDDRDAR
jgi:hypothetical protein